MNATDSGSMTITLDIAAILSAIVWPIILVILLLVYRKEIPGIFKWLGQHVRKLEFAGISLELAFTRSFTPDWSETAGTLDLRRRATPLQVNETYASIFIAQMGYEKTADYVEIDLGSGDEWFLSRLFIMAIILARLKGIECFIFVETAGNRNKQYAGWADPWKIRKALARQYPWFEQAYAFAYATVKSWLSYFVTNDGILRYDVVPEPRENINLLGEFLKEIQKPATDLPTREDPQEWIKIEDEKAKDQPAIIEHTSWATVDSIKAVLGNEYHRAFVRSSELRAQNRRERFRRVLSIPDRFVPVISDDGQLENLIDRNILLKEVGQKILSDMEEGNG